LSSGALSSARWLLRPAVLFASGAACKSAYQGGSPIDKESEAEVKQHFLNFFPLPHGQGSLRPILR